MRALFKVSTAHSSQQQTLLTVSIINFELLFYNLSRRWGRSCSVASQAWPASEIPTSFLGNLKNSILMRSLCRGPCPVSDWLFLGFNVLDADAQMTKPRSQALSLLEAKERESPGSRLQMTTETTQNSVRLGRYSIMIELFRLNFSRRGELNVQRKKPLVTRSG